MRAAVLLLIILPLIVAVGVAHAAVSELHKVRTNVTCASYEECGR